MDYSELFEIVEAARRQYQANAGSEWLVSPGAPVLFFGDLPGFEASRLRVATVGLNPSRLEFPKEAPFRRFPRADSADECSYLSALFAYFQNSPYGSWFGFYEQSLLGMGASYYGATENTALHTDIASVLPTDPTWSGLAVPVRERLAWEGARIWHRLIECLQPDILLQSTGRQWLELVEFPPVTHWKRIHTFELTKGGGRRKRPIGIEVHWFSLSTGKSVLIAHVPASQKPLAGLSHQQKRQVGEIVMEHWQHGIQ